MSARIRSASRSDARRRALLTISLLAFALDLLYGMVVSTFSLYVAYLGGSALVVGLLAATVSITELATAFPIGSFSDWAGRKGTFAAGCAAFGVAGVLVAVASEPLVLIVPRVLFGAALLATFPVGLAYLADGVSPSRRTLAIGLYVSAQGFGFALGPLLGGWIADAYGFRAVYAVCAVVGGLTTVVACVYLDPAPGGRTVRSRGDSRAIRGFLQGPMLGAGVSNTFMLLAANGAVLPFLALYGAKLGLGTLAVGTLYAARSGASVLARLPAGLLNRRVSNATLVLAAVVVDALAALAIGLSGSRTPLFAAAVLDGVCYGIFMTSGQCIVADEAPPGHRGAAIAVFTAAGALGETTGALGFGVLADLVTVRAVFFVTALLLALCVPLVLPLLHGATAIDDRRTARSI